MSSNESFLVAQRDKMQRENEKLRNELKSHRQLIDEYRHMIACIVFSEGGKIEFAEELQLTPLNAYGVLDIAADPKRMMVVLTLKKALQDV